MINSKRVMAIIPARGGSKGIKNKNIVDLLGKPLISYTIEAAKNCMYIDDVIVSTDSETIRDVARSYGAEVPFLRPASLATDKARTIDAVLYTINHLKELGRFYDILILLQPTSPLRDSIDISLSLEHYCNINSSGLVAISEVDTNPILIREIDDNGIMKKLIDKNSTCRRQDMGIYYAVNGSIYINNIDELNMNTSFNDNKDYYIISSEHAVDIDNMTDLLLAEYYLH